MRLIRLCLVLALVSSFALGVVPAVRAEAQAQTPTFTEGKCPFKGAAGLVEGQTIRCGTVTVPEDHNNPNGKTIKIAVAVLRSSPTKLSPDPIIYLDGGPGGYTLAQADSYAGAFNGLLKNHDVILFDQRGVGYSTPSLYCPEVTDVTYQQLGEVLSPEVATQQQTDATLACRARLVKMGVNLAVFNSTQNAADVDSIRQALGYQTLNLYGISYGTRLALTVMRDFPKSVRSAVIDSVVPLEVDLVSGYIPGTERVFKQLWDSCANNSQCNQFYPNLEKTFYQTVDKLNANPIKITAKSPLSGKTYPVVVNGNALLSFLFESFYLTQIIPQLPWLIYQAHNGQVGTIASILVVFADETAIVSYGMYYSVDCREEAPFTTLDKVKTAAQGAPPQIVTAEMPGNQGFFAICSAWGTGSAPAIENQPVKSDIPTLVMAGSFDPVTPPTYSKQVAGELSKSTFVEVPNSGHGASLSSGCPFQLVYDFFQDPTTTPQEACMAQLTGPRFLLGK